VERIIHGDCLEELKKIEDDSIDTVVTDPPYNVPVGHFVSKDSKWKRKWSDVSVLMHWWDYITNELQRILKPTGHIFVFCNADSYAAFYPAMYNKWGQTYCLVWDKMTPGLGIIWRKQHELIINGRNKGCYKTRTWGAGDVLKYKIVPPSKRKHPAEKPVDLLADIIKETTPPGGIVLDPFAGSGSTLVAAKREGFGFIGIEMEDEYVNIARERVANDILAEKLG
jgi:DNA modification methylase